MQKWLSCYKGGSRPTPLLTLATQRSGLLAT